MNPTIRTFIHQHGIAITGRRFEDFRKYALEPGQYLQHPFFGDSTSAITDGVHVIALFQCGIKEVHFNNILVIKPKKENKEHEQQPDRKTPAKPKFIATLELFQ